MEQPQRSLESGEQILPRGCRFRAVCRRQLRLHPFDVPVAEVAPEEVVHDIRRFMKSEMLQCVVYLQRGTGQPRENPSVYKGDLPMHRKGSSRANFGRCQSLECFTAGGFVLIQIEEYESRGIPNLVRECTVAEDAVFGEHDVGPR